MAVKRLSKVAREFNIGIHTIVDFLHDQGIKIESNPNTKLDDEAYNLLVREFQSEKNVKQESDSISKSRIDLLDEDPRDQKIKTLEKDIAHRDRVIGEITIANRLLKKMSECPE